MSLQNGTKSAAALIRGKNHPTSSKNNSIVFRNGGHDEHGSKSGGGPNFMFGFGNNAISGSIDANAGYQSVKGKKEGTSTPKNRDSSKKKGFKPMGGIKDSSRKSLIGMSNGRLSDSSPMSGKHHQHHRLQ